MLEFTGAAEPLSKKGMEKVKALLNTEDAEIWTVLTVETRGCGFLPNKQPFILFERHIFSSETHHVYDANYPAISNPLAGGYGAGGENQFLKLNQACQLDRESALKSASWGIGQLMGFNYQIAGFKTVEEMVTAMCSSENEQLLGAANEILPYAGYLRNHKWDKFAYRYNGPKYAKNNYDTRLAAAYKKFSKGPLPDLNLRTAQIYLTYLGFEPGPVDGLAGRFTRSAMNEFQQQNGLAVTEKLNAETSLLLKTKAVGAV